MSTPSTYEEWIFLRKTVERVALLKRSPSETIQLRICAALTLLSGLLYAASFLKRRSGGMWTLKKDSEGYYHPNVHTTLPIFAALYAILDVAAVLLIENNSNHPVHPLPVTVQLLAYQALQVFAWLKIWAILYALLTSRLRKHASISNCSRTSNIVSPLVFNTFIIATITIVSLGQIPLIILLSLSIQRCRNQFFHSDLLIQQAASMSTYGYQNSEFNAEVAIQAILSLALLKDQNAKANELFKTYLLFIIAWMSFNTLLFSVSAAFLLHALRFQKNVLSSALENRKMLQILQESPQTQNKPRDNANSWANGTEDESSSRKSHRSFDPRRWKSWMDFARDDSLNDVAFWGCIHKLNQPARCSSANLEDALVVGEKPDEKCINDAALQMHCSTTTNYWYSTMGQTVISLGMLSSYLVMGFWLLMNSSQLSGSEKLIEAFVWSNWIWGGGPGLVLGIVACTVAFSPTPVLPQSSNKPNTTASTGETTAASSSNHREEILQYNSGLRRALSLFSRKAPDDAASTSGQTDKTEDRTLIPSSSSWTQPPKNIRRSLSIFEDLARQSSDSSVFSYRSARVERLSQGSHLEMCRDQRDGSTPDFQVEMEWIGSHKAIQGLREGMLDTESSD